LFDTDAAGALTREPLSVLVVAAQSPILTPYLRGRIALPAFVRALLLGDDTAARVLAPLVADSYPSLKPLIEDWRTAKSLNEKNFAAAFMIIQNPGMRYEIESGPGRLDPLGGVEPLDEIDALRDNWWGIPRSGIGSHPNFISAAESKTADDEWQKLSAINAPNYLCSAAIEHTRSHPDDDRNPRALYRCLTAVHLGCSNDHGTELARSAFQLLHRRYPNSVWSEKGNIWYRGDGCGGT